MSLSKLVEAEEKASRLFKEVADRNFIVLGITEKELNLKIYELAFELFGIKKYWHKRIVRAGTNTLLPYRENPPDITIKDDDVVFLDFGPVFDEWEADFGRTYILGNDSKKLKLQADVDSAWNEGKQFYKEKKESITCAELYSFTVELSKRYGWEYGNQHCGHLIGNFPHERILGDDIANYIHPQNTARMSDADKNGNTRYWIYEIHLIDTERQFGGFFEQMLD